MHQLGYCKTLCSMKIIIIIITHQPLFTLFPWIKTKLWTITIRTKQISIPKTTKFIFHTIILPEEIQLLDQIPYSSKLVHCTTRLVVNPSQLNQFLSASHKPLQTPKNCKFNQKWHQTQFKFINFCRNQKQEFTLFFWPTEQLQWLCTYQV